jgi:hypothetical protein
MMEEGGMERDSALDLGAFFLIGSQGLGFRHCKEDEFMVKICN